MNHINYELSQEDSALIRKYVQYEQMCLTNYNDCSILCDHEDKKISGPAQAELPVFKAKLVIARSAIQICISNINEKFIRENKVVHT